MPTAARPAALTLLLAGLGLMFLPVVALVALPVLLAAPLLSWVRDPHPDDLRRLLKGVKYALLALIVGLPLAYALAVLGPLLLAVALVLWLFRALYRLGQRTRPRWLGPALRSFGIALTILFAIALWPLTMIALVGWAMYAGLTPKATT